MLPKGTKEKNFPQCRPSDYLMKDMLGIQLLNILFHLLLMMNSVLGLKGGGVTVLPGKGKACVVAGEGTHVLWKTQRESHR